MTFFWFLMAYFTAYLLGHMKGEAHERAKQDRAYRRAEEKIVYLKERR